MSTLSALLLTIFAISSCGLVGCLTLRGILIRTIAGHHGLDDLRAAVKAARAERAAERSRAMELHARIAPLAAELEKIEKERKAIVERLVGMPKQAYVLVFELGTPGANMQSYNFIVTHMRHGPEAGTMPPGERQLWSKPRLVRVWGRNQTGAMAAAQNRFPSLEGFVLRIAEPADPLEPAVSRAS